MAFSNTYDTTNQGSAVSNREELSDELTMLAPEETPVLSLANKSKADAILTEWTTDKLRSPRTTGVAEGKDITSFTDQHAKRARLNNRQQRFLDDYMVSVEQEAVSSVGPADIANAEAKAILQVKRDIEATLLSGNTKTTEDGAGTVNAMSGLDTWIDSSGPSDVPADYRTPAASIHSSGTFTETVLNSQITSIFRQTGMVNDLTLIADSELRRKLSDFARLDPDGSGADTSIRNVNYNGNEGQITLSVDVYKSHHGNVTIINMNPDCAPDTTNKDYGYLINPSYYSIKELRPLGTKSLPDLGGGPRGYVDCMLTLCVKHPAAHGKITVLS